MDNLDRAVALGYTGNYLNTLPQNKEADPKARLLGDARMRLEAYVE